MPDETVIMVVRDPDGAFQDVGELVGVPNIWAVRVHDKLARPILQDMRTRLDAIGGDTAAILATTIELEAAIAGVQPREPRAFARLFEKFSGQIAAGAEATVVDIAVPAGQFLAVGQFAVKSDQAFDVFAEVARADDAATFFPLFEASSAAAGATRDRPALDLGPGDQFRVRVRNGSAVSGAAVTAQATGMFRRAVA